ncbi:hypothetical protein IW262DRAFT_1291393 [Armillaria fumosa]|nr:hypothetical protein IW262DRAFT_1291393 [Armillaria fumosa]
MAIGSSLRSRRLSLPSIYIDKSTLGNAAVLGLLEDTHLTTDHAIVYLGYLGFEFRQNPCLQRLPVGKWLSFNIFAWAIAICMHAACRNFDGLFVVRFILGVCEGSIIVGFMIVASMFYMRTEQTLRVGYWFLMNGTAQIISEFVSFGTLRMKTDSSQAWKWLMIILGLLTMRKLRMIYSGSFSRILLRRRGFLPPEERSSALQRIKDDRSLNGHQIWLFALFSILADIPNSLVNRRQIIISSCGFSDLETTLLGCVPGAVAILAVWSGTAITARILDSRAWVGVIYLIPNLLLTSDSPPLGRRTRRYLPPMLMRTIERLKEDGITEGGVGFDGQGESRF